MSQDARQPADRTQGRFARAAVRIGVITAFIVGAAAVSMWNYGTSAGSHDRARTKTTQAAMRTIQTALNAHKADKGRYPQSMETLVAEEYFDKVFRDSWKHEFRYTVPGPGGKEFSLVSAGPDGQFGTEDDIDVWRIDE